MADMNIENSICEAIEYIVNNAVASAGFDKTIKATIVECTDSALGKYKVKYQNSNLIAYSQGINVTYTKGTLVYLLVPGNDFSQRKTILGSVSDLGNNYVSEAEGDEAYEMVGNNLVTKNTAIELCSYLSDQVEILYDRENNINLIGIDAISANTYFKQSSTVLCGATFKTSLPLEQQFRGNYGVVFEMCFKDNANGDFVIKNYVVDINQMKGDPYKLLSDTRQYGIFNIDGTNFQYVNRIYVFTYDFPVKSTEKPTDIFIKEFELYGANALSPEELSTCGLVLLSRQGTIFFEEDENASRSLQAEVRVKGKAMDVNTMKKDVKFYWFIEHMGINSASKFYCKYGGAGWKCLNNYNIIQPEEDGQEEVVEWIPGEYIYDVKQADSAATATKYKCVAVYETTILSKEVTITNLASNNEISIVSDSGTQFYFDIGTPTLTCLVNREEQTGEDYEYIWAEVDVNNYFYNLAETTDANIEYNNTLSAYNNLKAAVESGTEMAAASQEELNNYLTILKKYDKIRRVEKNKIYKIQMNTVDTFSTYKCSVYNKGVYIGTTSIVIKNHYEVNDGYSLVIKNGTQAFKYNEDGISPASSTVDNPITILPFQILLYNDLGEEVPESIVEKCSIQWTVPLVNTMIAIPDTYSESVFAINDELVIYQNVTSLSYEIADRYAVQKTNNTIKLKLKYKDHWFTAETHLSFSKEGDPGTNGTEYIAKIVPNAPGLNKVPYYPMVLNGKINFIPRDGEVTAGNWFNVQLWHNGQKIFEGHENSNSEENKPVSLEWSMLSTKYSSKIYNQSDFEINKDTGYITYNGFMKTKEKEYGTDPGNIIKCTVTYDGVERYATMPILSGVTSGTKWAVKLKDYTGFRFATYDPDGFRASYDNSNPFELIVNQSINGFSEDITYATNKYKVKYEWSILGTIYQAGNINDWIYEPNLKLKNSLDDENPFERNPISIIPIDTYNGECVNNALYCKIIQDGTIIAQIHIPIHMLLNRYGHAALNGWDGNNIEINKDGGFILAPQVGAGIKEEDNSFTGLLMGEVKESQQSESDVGLMGYHKGVKTIHIDARGGYAIFGKAGPGQIILDPGYSDDNSVSKSQAMLYSSNFWEEYIDDTINTRRNGLPLTSYEYNEYTHRYDGQKEIEDPNLPAGMLIDLTTPRILFGTGNFRVDPNGYLYAKGGGQIAGWNMDDDSLWTGNRGKDASDNVRISSSDFTRWINGSERTDWRMAFSNNFGVTSEGIMHAASGIIGSGYDKITLGKSTGDNQFSAIYAGDKTQFDKGSQGFYIGTDGIALGYCDEKTGRNRFEVKNTGELYAIDGHFAGKVYSREGNIGGWNINQYSLSSESGNIKLNSNGSMSGGGDNGSWDIYSDGSVRFKNGYFEGTIETGNGHIGGWNINENSITSTSGRTKLNSDGSMSGYGDKGQWSISSDGEAYFTRGEITGGIYAKYGTIGEWTIAGEDDANFPGSIYSKDENTVLKPDGTIIFGSSELTPSGAVLLGIANEENNTLATGGLLEIYGNPPYIDFHNYMHRNESEGNPYPRDFTTRLIEWGDGYGSPSKDRKYTLSLETRFGGDGRQQNGVFETGGIYFSNGKDVNQYHRRINNSMADFASIEAVDGRTMVVRSDYGVYLLKQKSELENPKEEDFTYLYAGQLRAPKLQIGKSFKDAFLSDDLAGYIDGNLTVSKQIFANNIIVQNESSISLGNGVIFGATVNAYNLLENDQPVVISEPSHKIKFEWDGSSLLVYIDGNRFKVGTTAA